MIFNPISIDPPDAGYVNSETLDGRPVPYPSRVYYLADGRVRLYMNKRTDRLVMKCEDETEDSVTLILTEPKEAQE